MSIAQCEFWSDTLDRWAEDLVDPAGSGTCNAKSKSSLPPALVLEAMQILEGEMNLREDTRVAEQAKPALEATKYKVQAEQLSGTQKGLTEPRRQAGRSDSRPSRWRERIWHTKSDCSPRSPAVMQEAARILAAARDRQPGHRRRDRGDRAACCSRSGSTPRVAAAAARRPAAAATARRSTRRWRFLAAASTRRKSGKIAVSRNPQAKPGRPCPKNSVPASTSISTGSNATRAVARTHSEIDGLTHETGGEAGAASCASEYDHQESPLAKPAARLRAGAFHARVDSWARSR